MTEDFIKGLTLIALWCLALQDQMYKENLF